MRWLLLVISVFTVIQIQAQSVVGVWKTIDDKTGEEKSHVEIYKKGDKYYGKVVEIFDPSKRESKCTKCTDDRKNQPVLGLEIIKGLSQDGDDFEDGTILDPNNGQVYDCTIWLAENDDLQVRGYVGFFFRTQTWKRIN